MRYSEIFREFNLNFLHSIFPALGVTINEIDISEAKLVLPKTKFSMYLPEVAEELKKTNVKSVVLFGIEVRLIIASNAIFVNELGIG